ncbi:hypothetical protein [Sporosarcina sp. E16_8]|uniref:hypothetical protein n=1 Tax=Sporosarcina sp. E16_8 TaxID=2789295 RepID=UPI001A934840|nr:hypothetical protein [Sporosarcina sp. E16_8]MBO0587977.1 hypothetical protein [Sporosarcina sp. E16_8]
MKRICLCIISLFVSISLMGCGSTGQSSIKDYNDDDIAAIVNGKEITIGKLRFLYPDEKVLGNIEGTVKAELVMQEAKKMHLDVSDNLNQTNKTTLTFPSKDTDDPTEKTNREFVDSQAQKFGMEPEEYYKKYVETTAEQIAYINAYTKKMLGKPEVDNEKGIQEYNNKANDLLNELVAEYKNEIEILIK